MSENTAHNTQEPSDNPEVQFIDPADPHTQEYLQSDSNAPAHTTAGAAAPHGDEGDHDAGHDEHIHEVPNAIMLIRGMFFKDNPTVNDALKFIEPTFFSLLAAVFMGWIAWKGTRQLSLIPGKMQNVLEIMVDSVMGLIVPVMGEKHARKHLPFLGSLFVFIWLNNMMGLIPFFKAPTSMFQTTLALGLCVFLYVQFHAIRMNGLWGYFHHLMGSPKNAVGWALAPLLFMLEIVGEFVKPVSLALRLFGNIMGEDILLFVFATIGVSMVFIGDIPVPIPLQFPFFFLALMAGTIQAMVFTLLATIYVTLFIPHEHGH